MRAIVLSIALTCAALPAGSDPAGFAYWSAAQLKGYAKSLAPKINAQKLATEQLGNFGNHAFSFTYRAGSGEAEFHQKQADIFVAETGEATLVVGGTIAEPRNTAPDEIRGASINGGVQRKLGPGDIVHIPAKTPHQVMLAPGKTFTYFVVKVNQ